MDTLLHRRLHFRGGWTPASPTTSGGKSPIAWWDAAAITGLNDGDAVSSWTDRVAGTYTATNTGTNRPTYKTGILNGKPVVRFAATSSQWLTLSQITLGTSWTVISVAYRSSTSNRIIPLAHQQARTTGFYAGTANDGNWYTCKTVTGVYTGYPYACASGWKLILSQGNTLLVRINGSAVAAGSGFENGAYDSPDSIGRHNTNYSTGDIAEIIVYTSALSAADITQIEGYLNTKWAVY